MRRVCTGAGSGFLFRRFSLYVFRYVFRVCSVRVPVHVQGKCVYRVRGNVRIVYRKMLGSGFLLRVRYVLCRVTARGIVACASYALRYTVRENVRIVYRKMFGTGVPVTRVCLSDNQLKFPFSVSRR